MQYKYKCPECGNEYGPYKSNYKDVSLTCYWDQRHDSDPNTYPARHVVDQTMTQIEIPNARELAHARAEARVAAGLPRNGGKVGKRKENPNKAFADTFK